MKVRQYTAARVLDRAAAYVDRGWTQRAKARNADGDSWSPHSPDATCWCALGAVQAALGDLVDERTRDPRKRHLIFDCALDTLCTETGSDTVSVWNDDPAQTAQDVAGALRRAALRVRTRALFNRVFPAPVMIDIAGAPYCHACIETLPEDQVYLSILPEDDDAWWCANCGCELTAAAERMANDEPDRGGAL